MFEHVTLLLSFVYALALTHLLSSATELVIAGKRVRFSGLYTLWAINAAVLLMTNWTAIYALTAVNRWTGVEVLIQVLSAHPFEYRNTTMSIPSICRHYINNGAS